MSEEPDFNASVVMRLKSGNWSFGHGGSHHGVGTSDCPYRQHHHHDEFCQMPTDEELKEAGIDPLEFTARSRR